MTRPQWEDLPETVQNAIQAVTGPIVKAEAVPGGIMPGLAARLRTERDEYFVKAAPADSPAAPRYRGELFANRALPQDAPSPALYWGDEPDGWVVMLFEYVDGRQADLSPCSADLPSVFSTIERLHDVLVPSPWPIAPPVTANVAALQEKAHRLLSEYSHLIGAETSEQYRVALNRFDVAALSGETMLHYDLHAPNLRVSGGQVFVLDWSFACRGSAWVDLALLAPRMIEAGHRPRQVDALLNQFPGWEDAPRSAVAGLAALWTMFREYKGLFGPEGLREARRCAAAAGQVWLSYFAGH